MCDRTETVITESLTPPSLVRFTLLLWSLPLLSRLRPPVAPYIRKVVRLCRGILRLLGGNPIRYT